MKKETLALIWGLTTVIVIMLIWSVSNLRLELAITRIQVAVMAERVGILERDVILGVAEFEIAADSFLDELRSMMPHMSPQEPPGRLSERGLWVDMGPKGRPLQGPSGGDHE